MIEILMTIAAIATWSSAFHRKFQLETKEFTGSGLRFDP